MAHLRVYRENGVNVSQLHIEKSSKEKKQFISNLLPKQTSASVVKAIGGSLETFWNFPSLQTRTKS